MGEHTKGKCKYCGKEYTMGYMRRHISTCAERQKRFEAEKEKKQIGYFDLVVYGKYDKDYWLFLEVRETTALSELDYFFRAIWVECCGHLSAFEIGGESYEVMPDVDFYWDQPPKSMNYPLKKVLEQGMTFEYEYDFGSTTELVIQVLNYRKAAQKKDKITILSRNNPPKLLCNTCNKKEARFICADCAWSGAGLLCEDCSKTHECGEDMLLAVCNSPRMGVCGYDGSEIYPDQFLSDVELALKTKKRKAPPKGKAVPVKGKVSQ